MEHQIFCPRLFDGRQLLRNRLVQMRGQRIVSVEVCEAGAVAANALRLPDASLFTPGLIDIQVNGGGGALLNDAPSVAAIRAIAKAHAQQGTTAFLPTLISDGRDVMRQAISAARQACRDVPGVLGIHLEGPFLQADRRGIHRADRVASFEAGDLDLLASLGSAGRTLATLAPECVPPGTVRALGERGALVFAGHTDATYEQAQQALAEGLAGFTHLFNAMSQMTAREPGVVGAALLARHAYAGLVLDGHHLAPASVAVARVARGGVDRIVLVSDAMTPAGTTADAFMLQGERIRVEGGRCVDETGRLAGACITLADAVRIATTAYGFTLEEALACATRIPAELLGVAAERGVFQAGAIADAVVFDAALEPIGVMQGGRWISAPAGMA